MDTPQQHLIKRSHINVWRAKHTETGETHYATAYYNHGDGKYYPIPSHPYTPPGSFLEVPKQRSENGARRRVREHEGYSSIGNAHDNLGDGYEAVKGFERLYP